MPSPEVRTSDRTRPVGEPTGSPPPRPPLCADGPRTGGETGGPDLLSPSLGTSFESNNWVVAGALTRTGAPFMANDPHRSVQAPSLRYFVHLEAPDGRFGRRPVEARDRFVAGTFRAAVERLEERLRPDMEGWVYGQAVYKHAHLRHPLGPAVDDSVREVLDVGPAPRGGNAYTVNATGSGVEQTHGATFRVIADLSDWDRSVATQAPGQGGRPGGPHYEDLFGMWAADRFFPLLFSREAVDAAAEGVTRLVPDR